MPLRAVLDEAFQAQTFEALAQALLDAALTQVAAAVAGRGAKLLRAMVHLRPDGGYRGLAIVDGDARKLVPVSAQTSIASSSTAWRLVEQHALPVEIDVKLALACVGDQEVELPTDADDEDEFESRHALLERSVTHILAMPLRGLRGRVIGMVSIEAEHPSGIGGASLWTETTQDLGLLIDGVAGHLLGLPTEEPALVLDDPLLPVVGVNMKRTIRLAGVFATQPETLLVLGPTGAGKSRLAQWCHARSGREGQPFEAVDLMTVPEEMQMAELFGWKRGAFTGAASDHPGHVERARGGTLFIDEIDKLSLKSQAGLLSFLESRTFRRLGDAARAQVADVRLIIGTNADLHKLVEAGEFREDLYYRINVLPVRLLGLSERADEVPAWARFMAERRHEEAGLDGEVLLAEDAGAALGAAPWPGNLRQLDNIVRRAYAIALADADGSPAVTVTLNHVEAAMAFDSSAPQGDLDKRLTAAASAAGAVVQRQHEAGQTIDFDVLDGFKGMVLSALVGLVGSREDAFRMLGRQAAVTGRNHHKLYKREPEGAEALRRALGLPGSQ